MARRTKPASSTASSSSLTPAAPTPVPAATPATATVAAAAAAGHKPAGGGPSSSASSSRLVVTLYIGIKYHYDLKAGIEEKRKEKQSEMKRSELNQTHHIASAVTLYHPVHFHFFSHPQSPSSQP